MSREILFKAKRLDNGEWVEGYVDLGYMHDCGVALISTKDGNDCFKVNAETICQYTGVKDKNDKMIWENDIVEEDWGNFKGVVKFGEFESNVLVNIGFSIDWSKENVAYRQDLAFWAKKVEVIDNVFENPELLEVKK